MANNFDVVVVAVVVGMQSVVVAWVSRAGVVEGRAVDADKSRVVFLAERAREGREGVASVRISAIGMLQLILPERRIAFKARRGYARGRVQEHRGTYGGPFKEGGERVAYVGSYATALVEAVAVVFRTYLTWPNSMLTII